jgi:hypothetical protein
MTRKSMVLALAAVLVVAIAIPVAAQQRAVTPKLQKISKRALKKSGTALRTSRTAMRQTQVAKQGAREARGIASAAVSAAGNAQTTIASTQVRSAFAPDQVTTGSEEFLALAGGPAVQVTVPASGLIEVWAQATINEDGAVSFYEDGRPMGGQAELCGPEGPGVLFAVEGSPGEPLTVATPAGPGIGICGSLGAPAPVLFQTTPGAHTYELRYADCGCGGEDPSFSNRRLFVGPRL